MTTWDKVCHALMFAGGLAVALAAPPLAIVPAVVGAVGGVIGGGAAYFASNRFSLANATPAALELAKIAKETQAALTKGGQK